MKLESAKHVKHNTTFVLKVAMYLLRYLDLHVYNIHTCLCIIQLYVVLVCFSDLLFLVCNLYSN